MEVQKYIVSIYFRLVEDARTFGASIGFMLD